ncbi:MAG TPA: TonB-dependent receptor, partial [Cellvibrio sp.]
KLLGAPRLKPEESENSSLGLVFEPLAQVFASIDVFQIDIDERIINTGNLNGPAVRDAIASNGIFFQGSSANLAFFTNGVDTQTKGVDLVLDWSTDLEAYGQIRWNLTGTRIKTEVTHIKNASPQLGGSLLITPVIISGLEESTPEHKVSLSANYYLGNINFLLRLTRYGESSQLSSDAGTGLAPFTLNTISPATLTDIALGYDFNDAFSLTLGANNLFDKHPEETAPITRGATNASVYPTFAPYPVDGTYYYLRSSFRF